MVKQKLNEFLDEISQRFKIDRNEINRLLVNNKDLLDKLDALEKQEEVDGE